ncbi:MAG: TRAP transporter small permease [Hydrogenophaga sp.]|jgi:TRAP-type C4-dicarboxylate transport system permease small subunit|uniref:TRAP transporter small permease subunit n=1 Tax=Hydrogenophaga sp. TaxID=1904254 RepID=UPI00260EBEB1|nr:TRAP transporter small permease [Hydrogenophaga sp.]MCV0440192.1 TRAP transporter small permease [Hydrogenophaga sp.]
MPTWVALVHGASRLLGVVAAALLLVSIFVVCHMVFVRAVLGESSIWQTEFVTYALVASAFIGAPYILLTRGHVAVDVLPLVLRPAARRWLHLVGSLIGVTFCGFFLYAAVPWWHESWATGLTTASIWRARLWIPYLAVPVGLGLLCLQYLAEIWMVWTQREDPFGLTPEDHL